MPILPPEPDIFPHDLLDRVAPIDCVDVIEAAQEERSGNCDGVDTLASIATSKKSFENNASLLNDMRWWIAYTKSRQEKQMMRLLRVKEVSHYAPQVPKRNRSRSGRIRVSSVPLFSNYVFVCGSEMDRYNAVCTGCVLKIEPIHETEQLVEDLRQIRDLIAMEVPMTIEARIEPGERVRVRSGPFSGYEGIVTRRDAETRLIVGVRFMDQGVSVRVDDCQVEKL